MSYSDAGVTVGALTGAGDIFLGSKNLGLGTNGTDMALSGMIQDGGWFGGVGGSLTKLGNGSLTLSGTNTYSGGTTLSSGVLNLASTTALGVGPLFMQDGTTLQSGSAGLTVAYNISSVGNTTLDTNGNDTTLSGNISGTGSITKIGVGVLTLADANLGVNGQSTTVAGGSGGDAGLSVAGKMAVDPSTVTVSGADGVDNASGDGGNGGSATASVGTLDLTDSSTYEVTGGNGGKATGTTGNGGNGGNASFASSGAVSIDASSLTVVGGEEGSGYYYYEGVGGNASVSIGSDLTVNNASNLVVSGGDGVTSYGVNGRGGSASLVVSGSVTVASSDVSVGGGVAGGRYHGVGGDATVSIGLGLTMTDSNLDVVGGMGDSGYNASGLIGGDGGAADLTVVDAVNLDSTTVNVVGGVGGWGYSGGGIDGTGGNAAVSLGSDASLTNGSELNVTGGVGGDETLQGSGGHGGSADLTVAGTVSMDSSDINVTGGNGGNGSNNLGYGSQYDKGGNGGDATVAMGSLILNGGSYLDVTAGNGGTGLSNGTDGNASVSLGSGSFTDGSSLNIASNNGGSSNLTVAGPISADSSSVSVTGGNASVSLGSASLSTGSSLDVTATNGSANLTTSGALTVTNLSTVNVSGNDATASLGSGSITNGSSINVVSGDGGSSNLTVAGDLAVSGSSGVTVNGGTASASLGSASLSSGSVLNVAADTGSADLTVVGALTADGSSVFVVGDDASASLGSVSLSNGALLDAETNPYTDGSASVSLGSASLSSGSALKVQSLNGSSDLTVAGAITVNSSSVSVSGGTASVSVGSLVMTGESQFDVIGVGNGSEFKTPAFSTPMFAAPLAGGTASLVSAGAVSLDSSNLLVSAGNGADNYYGDADSGSDASVSIGSNLAVNDSSTLNVFAGNGGNSYMDEEYSGLGGNGGSADLTVAGAVSIDSSNVDVYAGNAGYGNGDEGMKEMSGGNASASLGSLTMISGSALVVAAGTGGEDDNNADAGDGGSAVLTVAGAVSMDSSSVIVEGGLGGYAEWYNGGNGGDASVSVGSDLTLTGGSNLAVMAGQGGEGSVEWETGVGGQGGSAGLTVAGAVSMDASSVDVVGGSSSIGWGVSGQTAGVGGDATASLGGLTMTSGSTLDVTAGDGGRDLYEAYAGDGGSAILTVAGAVSMDSSYVDVLGGNGGTSDANFGNGGASSVSLGSLTMASGSALTVMGGSNGLSGKPGPEVILNAADSIGGSGSGGNGGDASLTVADAVSMDSSDIQVLGGNATYNNDGLAGNGGNASVSLGSLAMASASNLTVMGGTSGFGGASGPETLAVGFQTISTSNHHSLWSNARSNVADDTQDNGGDASLTVGSAVLEDGSSIDVLGGDGSYGDIDGVGGKASVSIGSLNLVDDASFLNVQSGWDDMGEEMATSSVYLGGLFGTGSVTVMGGPDSTLQVASGDFSGSINGDIGLEKVGGSNSYFLTLRGVNNYTGATTVTGGILAVDTEGTLGTSNWVTVGSAGQLDFINSKDASALTIENDGVALFMNQSTAGDALIDNTGWTMFADTSDAGIATINNTSGGKLSFFNASSAANADIHNGVDCLTAFTDTSDGGSANIDNDGALVFEDSSNAASITVMAEAGSWNGFIGDAQGGNSVFELYSGTAVTEIAGFAVTETVASYFDISGSNAGVTVGSISGEGDILLGSKNLGVGVNNTDMYLYGSIADGGLFNGAGGSLTKLGTGTLTLGGVNDYTGGTFLEEGRLSVASTRALGLGNVTLDGGDLCTNGRNHLILVGGNYTQSAAATLSLGLGGYRAMPDIREAEMASPEGYAPVDPTIYDRLVVVGTATLGGTLDLSSSSFHPTVIDPAIPMPTVTSPTIGDSYLVISTGGGLSGRFTTITDPYTDVRLYPVYMSYELLLETMPISFLDLGTTFNQKVVAENLDGLYEDPAMMALFAKLGTLKAGDYGRAYDQIAPSSLASLYTVDFRRAGLQASALGNRMTSFLAGQGGFGARNQYAGIDSGVRFAGTLPAEVEMEMARHSSRIKEEERWGGFFSGDGGNLKVTSDGNGEGYKAVFGGLTAAGVDYQVSRDLAIGLLLGYQTADVTADAGSRLVINGGQVGLYALAKSKGFYAQALGEGGMDTYDSQRAAFGGTASGHTKGTMYSGQLGVGYRVQTGRWSLGPTGSVQYTQVGVKAFEESGSLSPESFGKQEDHSLTSNLGARVAANLPLGRNATLVPVVSGSWVKEYHNDGGNIISSLGGTPFTVKGTEIGRSGFQVDGGLGLQWRNGMNLSVHYERIFGRTHFDSQTVGGEIHFNL